MRRRKSKKEGGEEDPRLLGESERWYDLGEGLGEGGKVLCDLFIQERETAKKWVDWKKERWWWFGISRDQGCQKQATEKIRLDF